jgi:hypothetical protein
VWKREGASEVKRKLPDGGHRDSIFQIRKLNKSKETFRGRFYKFDKPDNKVKLDEMPPTSVSAAFC